MSKSTLDVSDSEGRFPKLKGADNYCEWSRSMEWSLRGHEKDLWNIIQGLDLRPESPKQGKEQTKEEKEASLDWARRNNLAGSFIMLDCMSDQQELIHNLGNNAKDMWDKLAAFYKEQGFNLKYSAILELVNIRYANFTSASEYNSAFKRAQQKIKDCGILSSTDDLFSICFLQGFGDNYEAWVTAK